MKRVFLIVLDGCGVGEMPDADEYQDAGSNTLGNLAIAVDGMHLPNLERLGIGNLTSIKGVKADVHAEGAYGKMAEASAGKDSTTGHWELAGLIKEQPFPTYPEGFPEEVVDEFKRRTGHDILGNKPASGTEIIKELGEKHLSSGKPIIYTSADSVFQIAAHESVFPLEDLYRLCESAREMLIDEHAVARVIARPFTGNGPADFVRTKYRRDFSLKPNKKILLEILGENGIPTLGIGKIYDLYAGVGLSESVETKQNAEGMQVLLSKADEQESGLIMANLVDFDMLWGHRNNPDGFYVALKEFDDWLPAMLLKLRKDDILVLTADHGNDPTTPSTDHSREYVPVLVFGEHIKQNVDIGICRTFADLHATVAEYFGVPSTGTGESFLYRIMKH